MVRGSTPTHTFTLPNEIDVSIIDYTEITYSQVRGGKKTTILTKLKEDYTIDGQVIILKLTQEETFSFTPGEAKVELRCLSLGKDVIPSQTIYIYVEDSLSERVLK